MSSAVRDVGVSDRLRVQLEGPADREGFRRAARRLLAARVGPAGLEWQVGRERAEGCASLWDAEAEDAAPAAPVTVAPRVAAPEIAPDAAPDAPPEDALPAQATVRVPAAFNALCDQALLHRDPGRFELLYRLLWRLQHEPGLRHDPLDPEMLLAQRMAREVARDLHKMRAFVRFTRLPDERHVAWFEPLQHIVEENAPFFMRRFANMRWAILTPQRCVEWDGAKLHFAPGADDASAGPAPDAGEALWLTYYASIFNPARPKLAMMRREMPRRYWPNLPEAALIQPLAEAAAARSRAMVDAAPTPARRSRLLPSPHLPAGSAELPISGRGPGSLAELNGLAQACRQCPIGAAATQAVCGEGPLAPTHMLVGEQPGDQEDLAGRPFVGPAGRLLDAALVQLAWARDTLYLANAVKHFKYELRGRRRIHKTASQREALACGAWLESEIALVRPAMLVALGATAARSLLGRPVAVQAERGRWIHERADGRPVFVTLHPSALLRLPPEEREAAEARWLEDLTLARRGAQPT